MQCRKYQEYWHTAKRCVMEYSAYGYCASVELDKSSCKSEIGKCCQCGNNHRSYSRINLTTYADDITILSTHTNINTAKQQAHSYLQDILNWTKQNNLILNPSKSQTILFTPHPAEHSINLRLTIPHGKT